MSRKPASIDLVKLEMLAQRGLSKENIARLLGMNPDTLYEHIKRNPEITEIIERGKAQLVLVAAETILQHAKNVKDPRVAENILKKFDQNWRDVPTTAVQVNTNVQVQNDNRQIVAQLGEDVTKRLMIGYLKTRGISVMEA